MSGKLRQELKACVAHLVSPCGLKTKDIDQLEGNPAGTDEPDFVNPAFIGKVSVKEDRVHIQISYTLSGNIARARSAVRNISSVFKEQKVFVEMVENKQKYDLRIHGASLGDFAAGLRACSCEDMQRIGGWGPHYTHVKWGDALLVNPNSHRIYWKMSDAHEFGHKLGLRHRSNLGLMDYWDEETYREDPRKFLPSDRARIIALYLT